MKNAKQEFIAHTLEQDVKCATVSIAHDFDTHSTFLLPVNHTPEQKEQFLSSIDVNYNDGYGSQELFGTIWYNDGTWSEREEYDGSEWWEYNECPDIPTKLK
jgi:hypothetical protein